MVSSKERDTGFKLSPNKRVVTIDHKPELNLDVEQLK